MVSGMEQMLPLRSRAATHELRCPCLQPPRVGEFRAERAHHLRLLAAAPLINEGSEVRLHPSALAMDLHGLFRDTSATRGSTGCFGVECPLTFSQERGYIRGSVLSCIEWWLSLGCGVYCVSSRNAGCGCGPGLSSHASCTASLTVRTIRFTIWR